MNLKRQATEIREEFDYDIDALSEEVLKLRREKELLEKISEMEKDLVLMAREIILKRIGRE